MNVHFDEQSKKTGITALIIMCIVVFFLFLISWFLIDYFIESKEERGTFGDKFGSINALFSGLAFAGLIYTIILQRKDLEMQREELELTRKEMKEQTAEFEKQNQTTRLQQFENTFFNLLELQQSIVNDLRITINKRRHGETIAIEYSGREVFYASFYKESFVWGKDGEENEYEGGLCTILRNWGIYGYNNAAYTTARFDHYFRHLYHILKFVDETEWMEDILKYKYTSILRATISPYELVWIYYNSLSEVGTRLKNYIEEYSLLKNLRDKMLILSKENEVLLEFREELEPKGFYVNDYYSFMTDQDNEPRKYTVSAFASSKTEKELLVQELYQWNSICKI